MISQSEFFDQCADNWDGMERADMSVLVERVVRESCVAPGMRVLDVGTGTGVLIPCLLRAMDGAGEVCAIDISQGMLRVAGSKGFPGIVRLVLADIEEFDLAEGPFDRVMCNAVFPHFTNKPAALRRVYDLLPPGGIVVISHPTGRDAVNKIHREAGSVVAEDRVPTAEKMRSMLEEAGFADVLVIDEPEFYLAKGRRP